MTLPERMRLAADILDEAQARYLSDYPWLADDLRDGWSPGGLRTYAEQWERQEAASA